MIVFLFSMKGVLELGFCLESRKEFISLWTSDFHCDFMWLIKWFCMCCINKTVKSMIMYIFMCYWVEVVLLCYPRKCERYWTSYDDCFHWVSYIKLIKLDIFIFLFICLLSKISLYINCFDFSKLEHWCWKIHIFNGNSHFYNLFHKPSDFWKF